ncbi:MAG TPA: MazG-like family protein [Bacillota bacterium]
MTRTKQGIDISRNIRIIEWLKSELLDGMAALFRALLKNNEGLIGDSLVNIVISCYFLGKRLGIGFRQLDNRIEERLQSLMGTDHQLERWYGEVSGLLHHFNEEK